MATRPGLVIALGAHRRTAGAEFTSEATIGADPQLSETFQMVCLIVSN